jgi:hypothetical protein
MSGQGQESTILVPAKDPEQKKNENEDQKPNGDVNKGKGKDEGKDEPDIVRVKSLSCPPGGGTSPGVLKPR